VFILYVFYSFLILFILFVYLFNNIISEICSCCDYLHSIFPSFLVINVTISAFSIKCHDQEATYGNYIGEAQHGSE